MVLPQGVKILQVTEGIRFQPGGAVLRTNVYSYMVGTDGPFTLELSGADNTPDNVAALITKQAASIAALRGAASE